MIGHMPERFTNITHEIFGVSYNASNHSAPWIASFNERNGNLIGVYFRTACLPPVCQIDIYALCMSLSLSACHCISVLCCLCSHDFSAFVRNRSTQSLKVTRAASNCVRTAFRACDATKHTVRRNTRLSWRPTCLCWRISEEYTERWHPKQYFLLYFRRDFAYDNGRRIYY